MREQLVDKAWAPACSTSASKLADKDGQGAGMLNVCEQLLNKDDAGMLDVCEQLACGNKPRCGLYSPIHVDMDMGVRVVKRPLYTAHVGAGAFLWKTGKRHGKWRFHNVSTG